MPISDCYLFKNVLEYISADELDIVPPRTRGIYVLYLSGQGRNMEVVYIGMARGEKTGVLGRIKTHRKTKAKLWTHFSVFEVWDNISREQVEELEGMFRHIYKRDAEANRLNVQKTYRPLDRVLRGTKKAWLR